MDEMKMKDLIEWREAITETSREAGEMALAGAKLAASGVQALIDQYNECCAAVNK